MSIKFKHNKVVKIILTFGKIYGYYHPHFIVTYNGTVAKVAIDRSMLEGFLPAEITNFILEWAEKNYLNLEDKWNQMMDMQITSYKKAA